MKTVRIKRSKWSRGYQSSNALLVTRQFRQECLGWRDAPLPKVGTMCCLGFACKALGASSRAIAGQLLPRVLHKALPGLNDTPKANRFCDRAARINDNPKIKDSVREQQLKKLAAKNGFKFVFVP